MSQFDGVVDRRGSGSYKWDIEEGDDVLPMWVADMDFKTAPVVIEALQKRVAHGVFGYTSVPDAYYDATINWFKRRHNWEVKREWFIYTSGVVPAISAIINAVAEPGDYVITQTPAFNCFFSSIRNDKCKLLPNPLIYKDGKYSIDFDDLEKKAADPKAKVMILCNPHNPSGRVWTEAELRKVGEICLKHNVFIIVDEIHNEIVYDGYKYIPFASLSEEFLMHSATCVSPSKSFNMAGLQISNIFAADPEIRAKIDKSINVNEVCDVNPFGVVALIAAYNEGEQWLKELIQYLHNNYLYVKEFFEKNLPQFPVITLEGTYLVWIDCKCLGMKSAEIAEKLLKEEKLKLSPGTLYGDDGEGFIRLNIACPKSTLIKGVEKIYNLFQRLTNKA